jgi:hypothetical protein
MKTRYTVWQLDNVLADISWRIRFLDIKAQPNERRLAFDALSIGDDPYVVGEFEDCRSMNMEPIFVVDRPEMMRRFVKVWIQDNLGVSEPLVFMRNKSDLRHSDDLLIDGIGRAMRAACLSTNDIYCVYTDHLVPAARVRDELGLAAMALPIDPSVSELKRLVYEP